MAKKKTKKLEIKKDTNLVIKDPEVIDIREDVEQALNTLREYCKSNRDNCDRCMYSTLIYNEALGSAHAFCDLRGRRPEDYKSFKR